MRNILNSILAIPSVEKRPPVSKWWGLKIFPAHKPKIEQQDVYIYNNFAQASVVVGVLVALVIAACYQMDFGTVWIHELIQKNSWSMQDSAAPIIKYLDAFCIIYRRIIYFALIPFFALKILWNINFKAYDVYAFTYLYQIDPHVNRTKMMLGAWVWAPALYVFTNLFHAVPYFILFRGPASDNVLGLILFMGIAIFLFSFMATNVLFALTSTGSQFSKYFIRNK